jgi:hypothetical protein
MSFSIPENATAHAVVMLNRILDDCTYEGVSAIDMSNTHNVSVEVTDYNYEVMQKKGREIITEMALCDQIV